MINIEYSPLLVNNYNSKIISNILVGMRIPKRRYPQ